MKVRQKKKVKKAISTTRTTGAGREKKTIARNRSDGNRDVPSRRTEKRLRGAPPAGPDPSRRGKRNGRRRDDRAEPGGGKNRRRTVGGRTRTRKTKKIFPPASGDR